MSELQAVFQARQRRQRAGAQNDDDGTDDAHEHEQPSEPRTPGADSEAAVVVAPPPPSNKNYAATATTTHSMAAPSAVLSQRRARLRPEATGGPRSIPTSEGVEVSPGADGREALRLGHMGMEGQLKPSAAGREYGGGSRGGVASDAAVRGESMATYGGARGHNGRWNQYGAQTSAAANDVPQDRGSNSGGGYSPIKADTAKAALRTSNKFGVRRSNPPNALQFDEPSDEELEETKDKPATATARVGGDDEPKNELQRKLRARRLKVKVEGAEQRAAGGGDGGDGDGKEGEGRTPKSQKVEMKWNSRKMAYEAVSVVVTENEADDDEEDGDDGGNAEKEVMEAKAETKPSATATAAKWGAHAKASHAKPSSGTAATAGRGAVAHRNTAAAASKPSWVKPSSTKYGASNGVVAANANVNGTTAAPPPRSPTKVGRGTFFTRTAPKANSTNTVSYGTGGPKFHTPGQTMMPRAVESKTGGYQTGRAEDEEESAAAVEDGEADERQEVEEQQAEPIQSNDRPRIGGRPGDFSRTVAGRNRSTSRTKPGGVENATQPRGMLSAMAKKYAEDRDGGDGAGDGQQQQQQNDGAEEGAPPTATNVGAASPARSEAKPFGGSSDAWSNAGSNVTDGSVPEFLRTRLKPVAVKKRPVGAVAGAGAAVKGKADEGKVGEEAPPGAYRAAFPEAAAVESSSRAETKAKIEDDKPSRGQVGNVRGRWQPPSAGTAKADKVSTNESPSSPHGALQGRPGNVRNRWQPPGAKSSAIPKATETAPADSSPLEMDEEDEVVEKGEPSVQPTMQPIGNVRGRWQPPPTSSTPYRAAFPAVSTSAPAREEADPTQQPPQQQRAAQPGNVRGRWQPPGQNEREEDDLTQQRPQQVGNVKERWQPAARKTELSESTHAGYPFRHESAGVITDKESRSASRVIPDPLLAEALDETASEGAEEIDRTLREEPTQEDEVQQQPMVYSYDTAVMAARDAIDVSNRSRRTKGAQHPSSPGAPPEEAEVSMVRDPSLRMERSPEPSPSSSMFDEDAAEVGGEVVANAHGTGGDRLSQLAQFVGDDVPPTPSHAASTSPSSTTEDFFGTDAFIKGTGDLQPEDPLEEPAFGSSDPFDPFATGNFSYQHQDSVPYQHQDSLPYQHQESVPTSEGSPENAEMAQGEEALFEANFGEVAHDDDAAHSDAAGTDIVDVDRVVDGLLLSPLADPDQPDLLEQEPVTELSRILTQSSSSSESAEVEAPEFVVDAKNFADADDGDKFNEVTSIGSGEAGTDGAMPKWHVPGGGQRRSSQSISHGSFSVRPLGLPLCDNPKDIGRIAEPIRNPMSGNMIACRHLQHEGFVIEEWRNNRSSASGRPTAVISARVLQEELAQKMNSKGTSTEVVGISSVHSLAAGVHRVKGRKRVRVAALVELYISQEGAGGCIKKMQIVAMWRWGYGQPKGVTSSTARASLQATLTVPDGYLDPKMLQIADGLIFLGGAISSRAAVFVAKPAVRDGWLALPVGDAVGTTVALAASDDDRPHLAVGLSDGTVRLFSYDSIARTNRSTQLRLLCHIRGESDVAKLTESDCLWPNEGQQVPSNSIENGKCDMSLAWINGDCSSGMSGLPLLACAFQSGLGVYHIAPAHIDQEQQSGAFPTIEPLAMAKYTKSHATKGNMSVAQISWFDMGPRRPPSLALLLTESEGQSSLLCISAIDIPWYGSDISTSRHRAIGVICQTKLDGGQKRGSSIVASPRVSGVMCCHNGTLLMCELDDYFSSLHRPVSSAPLGLDSFGSVHCQQGKSGEAAIGEYSNSVLSIFSVTSCGDDGGISDSVCPAIIRSQRHWLLLSSTDGGDSGSKVGGKSPGQGTNFDDAIKAAMTNNKSTRRGDEVEVGGATSDVLFELTCGESPTSGLIPERVITEARGSRAAVVFSSCYFGDSASSRTRMPFHPVAYAILDISAGLKDPGSSSFDLRRGRDVAFLPPKFTDKSEGGFYCSSLVVLDDDGTSLSVTTAISSSVLPEGENERVVESIQRCSLQYEGIEGRRVFTLLNGDKPEILLYGYSNVIGRPCLLLSRHRLETDEASNQLTLIESTELGHRLWLEEGEKVLSMVELPIDSSGGESTRANIALASQQRVMIISVASNGALSVVAEVDVELTSANLIPLGSHCVAFCAVIDSSGLDSCIRYLSCLKEEAGSSFNHGVIATLPAVADDNDALLLAICQDRCIYQTQVVNDGELENGVLVPLPRTRPILLLEPFVANALCLDEQGGKVAATNAPAQRALQSVIERFGRKDNAFPYGDECGNAGGIGTHAAGVTRRVHEMLVSHGCREAALVLLTGKSPGDDDASPRILPPWIPVHSKLSVASLSTRAEENIQVLSQGEDPAHPGLHEVASILAEEMAMDALRRGSSATSSHDTTNLLSIAKKRSSELLLGQLALTNDDADSEIVIKCAKYQSGVSQLKQIQHKGNETGPSSTLPSWLSQLAPSIQCAWEDDARDPSASLRSDIQALISSPQSPDHSSGNGWKIDKNKHVWHAGPLGKQERLLSLDDFESWSLGLCRPSILGKEGIEAGRTGESALASILQAAAAENGEDDDESKSEPKESMSGSRKNWVEGIGESRIDEDNLTLYLRFSEGARDEDFDWKSEGFADLTKQGHRARVYGADLASLEATTSSVDEGEEGKVHLLYDLVYSDGAPRSHASGLVIEAPRGSGLDVGMLHDSQDIANRGKCTIELWYHLPMPSAMTHEIVLTRRSLFYEEGDDASKLCLPDEKHNVLWELVVLPSGVLELRTGAGSVVTAEGASHFEREDGLGGWNQVSLLLSQLASSATECSSSIVLNGVVAVSNASLLVNPFGSDPDVQDLKQEDIADVMERTVMIFGIGPSIGFRLTDVRVWACSRSEDDIAMMMHECLRDAEIKKKFRVSISNKEGAKKKKKSLGALPPPPGSKKGFALAPPRPSPAEKTARGNHANTRAVDEDEAFVPDFASFGQDQEATEGEAEGALPVGETIMGKETDEEAPKSKVSDNHSSDAAADPLPKHAQSSDEVAGIENVDPPNEGLWDDFHLAKAGVSSAMPAIDESEKFEAEMMPMILEPPPPDEDADALEEVIGAAGLSFDVAFSDRLSNQVRKSAAAAIVRGPPATRHLGGNRGGLPLPPGRVNFGGKHPGASPIAICGADKSVVWFSDGRDPPGRTFPIGASGAVLSDVMDESGTEYMCCFLAKEKRIVVFELSQKTVVVELQMKTKLNFWQYLPREAHGGELAFVLITPIGGFHWKPLDESPRPSQVWRRGPELESKKILAYEEGGSNGQTGGGARSTVALVISSSSTPRSTVEACCIAMNNGSGALRISNILGAALCCPHSLSDASAMSGYYFLPFIVTISMDVTSKLVLDIEDLREEDSGAIVRGSILASTGLELDPAEVDDFYEPPSMSMGPLPEVLCCCHGGFIVAIVRNKGLVYAYDFASEEELIQVGKSALGQYIVDASIRSSDVEGQAELVLLLSETEDSKDGRIATVTVSRDGEMGYLSSI